MKIPATFIAVCKTVALGLRAQDNPPVRSEGLAPPGTTSTAQGQGTSNPDTVQQADTQQ